MRAEIRRAYRCPCDGRSHRQHGRVVSRRARAVLGELAAVEKLTGSRPNACPWAGFYDPEVALVLQAYDFFLEGQASEFWGNDPPWWMVLAVRHYHRVLGRVRADAIKLARKKSEELGPRLPPGAVVEHRIQG